MNRINIKMGRFYKLLIVFLLTLGCSCAWAILEIEITQGMDDALPLVVCPFKEEGYLPETTKLTPIITNNLKNSGRFQVTLNQTPTLEEPQYWRQKKMEAMLTGSIQTTGSQHYQVTFTLFDLYNHKKLLTKEYQIKKSQLRKLAHHISDLVYEQLTGDRGVFSTKIAYVMVKRSGKLSKYQLHVADSDGQNTQTLLTSSFPIMSLAWSPDASKLAYVSFEGHRAAIYIQDVATGHREILTKFPGINGAPAWSPDGKKMALVLTKTGYPKIYLLNLATKQLEQLTDGWYLDTEPNWSNDGRTLVFTSNRGGTPQIYAMELKSKKIKRVTYDGTYNARARFTPDDRAIVILHKEAEMFTIASQELATGRLTILSPIGLNESPSIAPNGKMVVYATNRNNRGMLAASSIDGRVRLVLPSMEGEVQEPAWSPFPK